MSGCILDNLVKQACETASCKEVVLSMRGSGAKQITSSSAKTLISWMESVFAQGRTSPQEPVDTGKVRPVEGTPVPEPARSGRIQRELSIIQKIPAPKQELKVEVHGPFPIEEQSK